MQCYRRDSRCRAESWRDHVTPSRFISQSLQRVHRAQPSMMVSHVTYFDLRIFGFEQRLSPFGYCYEIVSVEMCFSQMDKFKGLADSITGDSPCPGS